jgi:hypothetical protein
MLPGTVAAAAHFTRLGARDTHDPATGCGSSTSHDATPRASSL